mgnify:CR=1 FL=1
MYSLAGVINNFSIFSRFLFHFKELSLKDIQISRDNICIYSPPHTAAGRENVRNKWVEIAVTRRKINLQSCKIIKINSLVNIAKVTQKNANV